MNWETAGTFNLKQKKRKWRQSDLKLCLKLCFGVERALTGTPLGYVLSLFITRHIWVKLASFYVPKASVDVRCLLSIVAQDLTDYQEQTFVVKLLLVARFTFQVL